MDNTNAATNMPTTARPTAVVCASSASESATSGPATRGGRNGATSPKPTMLPMASDAAAGAREDEHKGEGIRDGARVRVGHRGEVEVVAATGAAQASVPGAAVADADARRCA